MNSVAWSKDPSRLASASFDSTVKIWDPVTGQCVSTLEGHSDLVNSVAWSNDSNRLASASTDYTVKIWDPTTGKCVLTFAGHGKTVNSVAWSNNSARLASASGDWLSKRENKDCTVKIWDLVTAQCVLTLEGHSSSVKSVALSHDSTRLASMSYDTIKIWNPVTGKCVSTLEFGHPTRYLQFHNSDSDLLYTGHGTINSRHVQIGPLALLLVMIYHPTLLDMA